MEPLERRLKIEKDHGVNQDSCVEEVVVRQVMKQGHTALILTPSSILKSLKKLLQEEFECSICLGLCEETLMSPDCGHRFCKKCIKESLTKCNHECPTCRVHIPTYRSCHPDAQFDRIVSVRRVICFIFLTIDSL